MLLFHESSNETLTGFLISDRLGNKLVIRAGVETLDPPMLTFSLIGLSGYRVVLSRLQSYHLCTVRVRRSLPTDGVGVVSKGVEFVRRETELYLGTCTLPPVRSLALTHLGSLMSFTGVSLLWELLGFKPIAELSTKVPESSPEWLCEGLEGVQGVVCMEAKFGVGVPSREEENEIKDLIFILLRQQKAFDHQDDTLHYVSRPLVEEF